MKVYTVCHQWLSPIQKGVQGYHSGVEMFVKHKDESAFMDEYMDWATNHKTLIFLQGGNSKQLFDMHNRLSSLSDFGLESYQTLFFEDEDSLGGAATALSFMPAKELRELITAYWDMDADTREWNLIHEYGIPAYQVETIIQLVHMKLVPA